MNVSFYISAIITMIFPCWTFGQIAEIVDNGQTCELFLLVKSSSLLNYNE